MDLESESVVLGSVETNKDGIRNNRGPENLELKSDPRVQNNGFYDVENNYHGDSDNMGIVTELSCLGSSLPVDVNSETSPSPTVTRKGYGLKKWRRIKRDPAKSSSDGTVSTSQPITEDQSFSIVNPSKRVQVHVDKKGKSEDSVSSTDAVFKSFDGFALLGESSLGAEALFGAGTDLENSEDRDSKSSTATSGHGKFRMEMIQKPRGVGSVKEKETSLSSLESDSRSSNFVLVPGTSSMTNGTRGEKLFDCDGKYDTDVLQNDVGRIGKERRSEEWCENVSPVNGVVESSWEVKVERKEANSFSVDKDSLLEAIDSLRYAQETLETEMLKFREISKHVKDFFSQSDIDTSSFHSPEMAQAENEDVEKEIEELLKNKIEAEVEFLAISSKVRNLRSVALNQITLLNSQQPQILHKLGDTRNKAVMMLKKETEEFEKVREELPSAEESPKLQKSICKYTSYFFLQIVLLVFIIGLVMLNSRSYEEVVPT